MGADQHLDWRGEYASTLAWWAEAGVDALVDEAPRDWLAGPARVTPAAASANADVPPSSIVPDTLDAFLAWRGSDGAPERGWGAPLISPSGPADATLMVLVDQPEREDADTLMSGAVGALFDRMLAAIGLSRETVLLASVAWARPVGGRVASDVVAMLDDLARRHVALAAPSCLLLMGNAASRALTATDLVAARGRLHRVNPNDPTVAGDGAVPMVATFHPRFLIERPSAKAEAWKDLQMLIAELTR